MVFGVTGEMRSLYAIKNTLLEVCPDIAKEWHPCKNEDLKPSDVGPRSSKTVWWKCQKGHEWEASPAARTRHGSQCPFCANRRVWSGYNDLASQYPDIAKEWHPVKNGDVTPDEVLATTTQRYWWRCENGHEWEASVRKRTSRGHGCHQCSNQTVTVGENDLVSQHPDIANLFHPTLNPSVELAGLAEKSNKVVWWQCDNGYDHPYSRPVYRQVEAGGKCPYCSNRRVLPGFNDLQHVHPELISEWDFDKNDKDPWEVTSSASYRARWKCEEGHEWTSKVSSRTKNDRISVCPQCQQTRTSFTEQCVIFYVKKYYAGEVQESVRLISDRKYEVDIFLPEYDLAVEYNGTFWHRNKQFEDEEKFRLLSNQRIRVIYVLEPKGHVIPGAECYAMDSERITTLEDACLWVLSHIPGVDVETADIDIHRDRLDIARSYRTKETSAQFAHNLPELLEMWDYEINNDARVYPYLFDSTSREKVAWKCPECHAQWARSVAAMRDDNTCPCCGVSAKTIFDRHQRLNHKPPKGIDHVSNYSLEAMLPDIACMWDARKNLPLSPDRIPYTSSDSYWWVCSEGHSWKSSIDGIRRGNSHCPYCAGERDYNILSFVRPDVAKTWHPTKNGGVTPDDVTYGSKEEYWWVCDQGHEYRAQVNVRCMEGYKCAVCSGHQVYADVNSLAALRPDIAQYWDYNKNESLVPEDVTSKSQREVWWKCEHGHEDHSYRKSVKQMTEAKDRLCPYCANMDVKTGFNDLASCYPDIARQWDYDKNEGADPTNVLYCSTTKYYWKCEECGYEWKSAVGGRTRDERGCPRCAIQNNVKKSIARDKSKNHVPTLLERFCDEPDTLLSAQEDDITQLCDILGVDDELLRVRHLYYGEDLDDIADELCIPSRLVYLLLERLGVPKKTPAAIEAIRQEMKAYDQRCLDRIGHDAAWLIDMRILKKKSVPAIAEEHGLSKYVLNRLVALMHISKRKKITAREELLDKGIDREWLEREHCVKQRSYLSIEKETGILDVKIAEACMQYRISYLGYEPALGSVKKNQKEQER